jgi:predicted flap endonuclease-1-like 5' DNA nuclease
MSTNPEDAAASAEKVETPVKAEEVQPLTKKLELLDVQPEVPVAVETKAPEPASVDDAPDPDEDDLDDLDGMFNTMDFWMRL